MDQSASTDDYLKAHQIFPSRHLIGTLRLAFLPEVLSESRHNSMVHRRWQNPAFHAAGPIQRTQDFHLVSSLARNLCTNQNHVRAFLQEDCLSLKALINVQYGRVCTRIVWNACFHGMKALRSLVYLILDIEDAYCPIGCCRMLDEVTVALLWLKCKQLDIRVGGQVIEGENAQVANLLNVQGLSEARAFGTDRSVENEGSNEGAEDIGDEQGHSTAEGREDDSEESDSGDEDSENRPDALVNWWIR